MVGFGLLCPQITRVYYFNMQQLIQNFSKQLHEALAISAGAQLTNASEPIHNVVIAGMGGSGIGGNLVTAWTGADVIVPITISKSYEAPGFMSKNTLFIACSFSGGTEETLAATDQALAKGAKVVCITSGGKLGEIAAAHKLDVITIPGESGSPRASIGYSFVQIMTILAFYGLIPSAQTEAFAESAALLDAEQADIQAQAKTLAQAMENKLPIFYADHKLEGVVVRTMQQIAENSKQLSHCNVFPEMNHNELVGWMFAKNIFENSYTVLLRTTFDFPRTSVRMDISKGIFSKVNPNVVDLHAKGTSFIAQSIYLIHLLDWVSFFLAEVNNVDPFPVDAISFLKNELAKV